MSDYILGVHIGHDSAAALFGDGSLLFAEEEERHSRTKNHFGSPDCAIDAALQYLHASDTDIVAIGVGWDTVSLLDSRKSYSIGLAPSNWVRMKINRANQIASAIKKLELRFPRAQVKSFDHHLAHSYSNAPFVQSAWNLEPASLVMDAVGEFRAVSAFVSVRDIKPVLHWDIRSSLGYFYQRWAEIAGFRGRQACGYFMSLSSFGDSNRYLKLIRKHCLATSPEGLAWIDPDRFDPTLGVGDLAAKSFKSPVVKVLQDKGAFENMDSLACLAAAIQAVTEEITLGVCSWLRERTDSRFLSVSGGVFMNCLLVSKIRSSQIFESVFVGPAVKDCGVSVGAGFLACMELCKWTEILACESPFLGTSIERDDPIWDSLIREGLATDIGANWVTNALDDLNNGRTVAIADGRLEFGPRALGARSILATPYDSSIRDRLNIVKSREKFQPIAASMSAEAASTLFGVKTPEPFMTSTYFANSYAQSFCPGVLHVDGGCRLQVVNHERSALGQILSSMETPAILANTSFNSRDQPLPRTSADVIVTYSNMDVNVLYGPSVRLELNQKEKMRIQRIIAH